MMRTVWKYDLMLTDEQTIALPLGAEPLSVAVQHGAVRLWALVEQGAVAHPEMWEVRCAGTGHPLEDAWASARYLGSIHLVGGDLVFHVWMRKAL